MPFCVNCGKELRNEANFCNNCGTPVKHINVQRNTIYEGDIHKCPFCGEIVSSFQTVCSSCGHEFRNASQTNAITAFENELATIERRRQTGKSNKKVNIFTLPYLLTADVVDQQLANRISHFPIPNNKEDIFEFMILAASNIDPAAHDIGWHGYQNERSGRLLVSNAWDAKYKQVYQKARIMFPSDQRLIDIEALYKERQKQIKRIKWKPIMGLLAALVYLYVSFAILIMLIKFAL